MLLCKGWSQGTQASWVNSTQRKSVTWLGAVLYLWLFLGILGCIAAELHTNILPFDIFVQQQCRHLYLFSKCVTLNMLAYVSIAGFNEGEKKEELCSVTLTHPSYLFCNISSLVHVSPSPIRITSCHFSADYKLIKTQIPSEIILSEALI